MTKEFLTFLVKRYPNSYSLGEMIIKFKAFCGENENLTLHEIEQMFIERFIEKGIHFQKAQ